MKKWPNLRVYIAGTIGLIACPCHLPLTLPLLLALTAGTAIGGWLANNTTVIYLSAALLFIGGLVLSGKWLLAGDRVQQRYSVRPGNPSSCSTSSLRRPPGSDCLKEVNVARTGDCYDEI